jgi:Glycosyltransferase family 87
VPTFITRTRALFVLAGLGYGLGAAALILLVVPNGGLAYDAQAYWLAGRHVLEGSPLYTTNVAIHTLDAWKYPPIFAQALAPFSLMPELVFTWVWRIICFLSLRALVGSWRNVGLALLFPPIWSELSIANVTFPVAYLALIALRGRPTLLPVAIALKFGPALLVPFILLRRGAADRRRLLTGIAAFAGLCGLSVLVAPGAWRDYLATIGPQASGGIADTGVISFASSGALDLALRCALGAAAVAIAITFDEERLAWAAAVITVPVLFVTRLAPLVAVLAWRALPGAPRQEPSAALSPSVRATTG